MVFQQVVGKSCPILLQNSQVTSDLLVARWNSSPVLYTVGVLDTSSIKVYVSSLSDGFYATR